MTAPALVTVVIPTRDANATLGAQLEALAGQSYAGDFEVLVADNGSQASPRSVVDAFGERLNVRVVEASARAGASFARNLGVELARGDLIAFCDADDVVHDNWLERLVASAAQATMVTGRLITSTPLNSSRDRAHRADQLDEPQLSGRPFMLTCNGAAWRDALQRAGGFDLSLGPGEDVDLSWRILDAGGRIAFVPDALVYYRLRSTPRQLFRQWFTYGRAEAALFRRYRGSGMDRRPLAEVLRFVGLVLLRWPQAIRGDGPRNSWIMWAGSEAGRVAGSIEHRVLYL